MSEADLNRVQALLDAGEPLDSSTARRLVAEVRLLRTIVNEHMTITIRPITPEGSDPTQAWFWTPEWQAGEREVDEEIAAGRVQTFDSFDELFAHLDED